MKLVNILLYVGWLALLAATLMGILVPDAPATAWVYAVGAVGCIWHDMMVSLEHKRPSNKPKSAAEKNLARRHRLQFLVAVISLCCGNYLIVEAPTHYNWAVFTLIYALVSIWMTFRKD